MTDDQTVESVRVMSRLERLITARGVEFTQSIVSDPLCCPSRATYLTGQYAHNHGVLRNNPPNGGFQALDGRETLPVWLKRAGYYTAHVGKYLNFYGGGEIPRGWEQWHGLAAEFVNRMYGYLINDDGIRSFYGDASVEDPALYQTDVLAQKAIAIVEERAGRRKPLFLSVSTLAPHAEDLDVVPEPPNPRAAPRHAGLFSDEPLPSSPAVNEADMSDKPTFMQSLPRLSLEGLTVQYQDRLRSLLAVDEMIGGIVSELREAGALRQTVLIFTSDNGFLIGEHRINDKLHPYEPSIRVPLMIRGPGIPKDQTRSSLVSNIDLAPTILDLAGAREEAKIPIDGRSLLPAIENRPRTDRPVLIEAWCGTHEACWNPAFPTLPRYQGVRSRDFTYVEHAGGESELYDLRKDPFQLESRHADPDYAEQRATLADALERLRGCEGRNCRITLP